MKTSAPRRKGDGMSPHVVVLDASRHQAFLKQRRRDPVTRKVLEPGDRIVVCAGEHCGLAFLEGSWRAIGERHGQHTGTLSDEEIEAHVARLHNAQRVPGRAQPGHKGAGNAPVPQRTPAEGGANAEESTASIANGEVVGTRAEPEPLGLKEISFQLREIPFSLRRVPEF